MTKNKSRNTEIAPSEVLADPVEAGLASLEREHLDSDHIPPAVESVEIDGHKFGVEEIDGQKYVLGAVINGVQLPDAAKALELGYYTKIDSSAALEIKVTQSKEGEVPES